jgi:hypothetical protein
MRPRIFPSLSHSSIRNHLHVRHPVISFVEVIDLSLNK